MPRLYGVQVLQLVTVADAWVLKGRLEHSWGAQSNRHVDRCWLRRRDRDNLQDRCACVWQGMDASVGHDVTFGSQVMVHYTFCMMSLLWTLRPGRLHLHAFEPTRQRGGIREFRLGPLGGSRCTI